MNHLVRLAGVVVLAVSGIAACGSDADPPTAGYASATTAGTTPGADGSSGDRHAGGDSSASMTLAATPSTTLVDAGPGGTAAVVPTAVASATGAAAATTLAPPPGAAAPTTVLAPPTTILPGIPRVLLVGDSTLLAVGAYGARSALLGMDPVYEAASCRALGQPSCGDDPPANAVTVIDRADGAFDVVVIMAGYDEWYTTFADSFDRVVASARAKGAKRVLWLTYPEGVDYELPNDRPANESLVNMNRTLFDKVAGGDFPDVVVADWFRYSAPAEGWYSDDDIHLSRTGAYGVADYIARKVAFLGGQPCPMPREPGLPVDAPCPDPDVTGPVPDLAALYPA